MGGWTAWRLQLSDSKNEVVQIKNYADFATVSDYVGATNSMPVNSGNVKSQAPLFHPPSPQECACTEFVNDVRFFGTCKKFKCQVHGEVTIDRRPLTQSQLVTVPAQPFPVQPPYIFPPLPYTTEPAWFNAQGGIVGQAQIQQQNTGIATNQDEPVELKSQWI